jgi:two-component system, OmpR family, phosphate regulon sensor histidine kinase PhoR
MNQQIQGAVDRLEGTTGMSARDKLNAFVDEAAALTDSKLAYFAAVNDKEDVLTMLGWSRVAMENCSMIDKPLVYPVEETGVWGDCIRERKPVIINDYPACEKVTKKGYPAGHVNVSRHANLPIWEGSHIAGVLGVGNKESDYGDEDMAILSEYAQKAWGFLKKEVVDEMSV